MSLLTQIIEQSRGIDENIEEGITLAMSTIATVDEVATAAASIGSESNVEGAAEMKQALEDVIEAFGSLKKKVAEVTNKAESLGE